MPVRKTNKTSENSTNFVGCTFTLQTVSWKKTFWSQPRTLLCPEVYDFIIFSAPCFTFNSISSCFSNPWILMSDGALLPSSTASEHVESERKMKQHWQEFECIKNVAKTTFGSKETSQKFYASRWKGKTFLCQTGGTLNYQNQLKFNICLFT